MIIVKLQGGLGNQMFQYALGRTVSNRLKTKLFLDLSFYNKSPNRVYELNKFNIKAEVKAVSVFEKIACKLGLKKVVKDRGRFDETILSSHDGSIFVDDWYISEKYFKEIENAIRKEFTLKDGLSEETLCLSGNITKENSISLHVRRGDYLHTKHINLFGILPTIYYEKAAKLITQKTNNPSFYIFSDDISWVKQNLTLPYKTEIVSKDKISTAEELILMSKCKHHIIANSSFSWWGAWLNPNPNKIVIAPKQWFVDKTRNSPDIIPDKWIQI